MGPSELVTVYLDLMRKSPAHDLDFFSRSLQLKGMSEGDAERLIAFVPMAFAHELLVPRGVHFAEGFIVRDLQTGHELQGKLMEEPIFVEAKRHAARLQSGDTQASQFFRQIAGLSAEFQVAHELAVGSDFSGINLAEPLLCRVPIAPSHQPRWWVSLRNFASRRYRRDA
jgi:hypothetical protein